MPSNFAPEPEAEVPRFYLMDDKSLEELIKDADSKNTRKLIQFAERVFHSFCQQLNIDPIVEIGVGCEALESLDNLLEQFYAGARAKNGEHYSTRTLFALKFGLQRKFIAEHKIDTGDDKKFPKSHRIFKAVVTKLKKEGKGCVEHHSAVLDNDMERIQQNVDLTTPQGLQDKVYIDIMTYFANRGRENVCDMTPDDFIINTDNRGLQFVSMRDTAMKNHLNDENKSQGGIMKATPGHPLCPVASLEKYKKKLYNPKCPAMWQRATRAVVTEDNETWYDNMAIGKNTLGRFFNRIARNAAQTTPITAFGQPA